MSVRVLVIDDEPTVRAMIAALLRRHSYDVETAADGDDGVARARTTKPDVILCDSRMPKVSGRQAIAELRADSSTAHIPVIIMSGHETRQSTPYADDFVPKPFGIGELLETIRTVISRGSAGGALKPA